MSSTQEKLDLPNITPLKELRELTPEPMWLVGGSVRDLCCNRSIRDYDVVTKSDVKVLARQLATGLDAHVFSLSEHFDGWRVLAKDRSWHVDFMQLVGSDLSADLARRDFTINAMAVELGSQLLIDPYQGLDDLRSDVLRVVSEHALLDDPVRILRGVRQAASFGLEFDRDTAEAIAEIKQQLQASPGERVFHEIELMLGDGCDLPRAIELLEQHGLLELTLGSERAGICLPAQSQVTQPDRHRTHLQTQRSSPTRGLQPTISSGEKLTQAVNPQQPLKVSVSEELADAINLQQTLKISIAEELAQIFNRQQSLKVSVSEELAQGLSIQQGLALAIVLRRVARALASNEPELVQSVSKRWKLSKRLTQFLQTVLRQSFQLTRALNGGELERSDWWRIVRAGKGFTRFALVMAELEPVRNRRALELIKEAESLQQAGPVIRGDRLAQRLELERMQLLGVLLERIAERNFVIRFGGEDEIIEFAVLQLEGL